MEDSHDEICATIYRYLVGKFPEYTEDNFENVFNIICQLLVILGHVAQDFCTDSKGNFEEAYAEIIKQTVLENLLLNKTH